MVLYSRYFQTFNSKDKVWLKALVVLQLSMDALGQIGQYIMVYQYGCAFCIWAFGSPELELTIVSGSLTGAILRF